MTERLFQYIWQFQYYNQTSLTTLDEEPLQIIHPGIYNRHQGPDFQEAKIKVGNTTWAGNIELHINSSEWQKHGHGNDKNYGNVILHVVWHHDKEQALPFPTLVLEERVSRLLLYKYEELMNRDAFIPCGKSCNNVNQLTWLAWKERLLAERMMHRSEKLFELLKQNNYHWEETSWWMIARNFGIRQNSDAFESIARSIPLSILGKHKKQLHQLEALLFGQAGLLDDDFEEDYPKMLQREYKFYQHKYQLNKSPTPVFFLRMRPANFPSLRLAQLAVLIHNSLHLFAEIKAIVDVKEVKALLNVTANDYWHYHYVFDELSAFKQKKLGKQMIDNIVINSLAPMLFSYGQYHNENRLKDRAIEWLRGLTAEKNNITAGFDVLGLTAENAFDSQALIQLKNEYCDKKRCLDCAVGAKLIGAGG